MRIKLEHIVREVEELIVPRDWQPMDKHIVTVRKDDDVEYIRIIDLPDNVQSEFVSWAMFNVLEPVKEKQGAVTLKSFKKFLSEVSAQQKAIKK